MFRWIVVGLVTVACVVATGCGRHSRSPDQGKEPRPDKELGITIELSATPSSLSMTTGGRIRVLVMVTNMSDEAKTLEFETERTYSVYVYDVDGRRYHVGPYGDSPVPSRLELDPLETKTFELAWDGHVWTEGDVVYLPAGKYEIEAGIKKALSNTTYVWLEK
jgi:hypothetical protein